jgi:hypothetical protein
MVASAAAGMAAVVSCGDDGPTPADADAAVCDCDGFEPALTAERVYRRRQAGQISPGELPVSARATCDAGDVAIGGGCGSIAAGTVYGESGLPTDSIAGPDFAVLLSAPRRFHNASGDVTGTQEGWDCVFDNRANTTGDVRYEATVICLDIVESP